MKEFELNNLLDNPDNVKRRIDSYLLKKSLFKCEISSNEINGHVVKSEHNLGFVKDTSPKYNDWVLVGCYYACYHAALALIISKGFYSKNHNATLCILINEFYEKNLSKDDIELLNRVSLDNEDILFYVQSKNKRHDASYSTPIKFDDKTIIDIMLKSILFVNKSKEIIKDIN